MLVNLSKNSWHAKYYNFVKGFYPTYEFKSLCPYFWTILSFVVLSPVILTWKLIKHLTVKPIQKAIIYGVGKAVSEPYKKKEPSKFRKWYERNEKSIDKWGGIIWFGWVILMMAIVLIAAIIELFKTKGAWLGFVYIFAFIGVIVVGVFIIWGIISFFETDLWKMIKGMGYSAKNKVCPMIKWDGKEPITSNDEYDLDYDY